MNEFVLIGSFRLDPRTGEYVGMIVKQCLSGEITVLTVGVEDSELAIMEWIKTTVVLMRTQGRTDVQAADKYDRLQQPKTLN